MSPEKRPLQRRNRLPVFVGLAWSCWSLEILLLWLQLRAGVGLPWFWPFALLMALWLAAAGLLLVGGLYRIIRGPARGRAFAWTALGLVPLLLTAAAGETARRQWSDRRVPRGLALELVKIAAASAAVGEAQFRYPHRLQGKRITMVFHHLESPEADLAAMEAHLEALEREYPAGSGKRVIWARGPLLGRGGFSFFGLAAGSASSPHSWSGPNVDRHELAHAFAALQRPPFADPPMLLHEGWAEARSGKDIADLAARALYLRDGDGAPGVRELTSPDWYHQDSGPVYGIGGAFVDFLVRRYGAERFFRLYNTCRAETFDRDVARVLGAALEEVEREFWQDVERLAPSR
ncbi:MAG: hypothetical protein ACK47B_08770 [Armatimonadota bacterium]